MLLFLSYFFNKIKELGCAKLELENQKYHNIKKTTETGVTKQKTIYKE
jgi:hypothetical protein